MRIQQRLPVFEYGNCQGDSVSPPTRWSLQQGLHLRSGGIGRSGIDCSLDIDRSLVRCRGSVRAGGFDFAFHVVGIGVVRVFAMFKHVAPGFG